MARTGRPQERELVLAAGERDELERISRSRSAAHGLVRRAEIILASAGGETNMSIARRLGVTNPTICHWRKKWFAQGIAGLYGEARPGRPRTHDEEAVAELLRTVLKMKPSMGSHWTVRSAAEATGHRSVVRRQGEGHCRALSQSAGLCRRAVRRREEPDSGARALPTYSTPRARLHRRRHPQLHPAWDYDVVCRTRYRQRPGVRAMQGAAQASGVSGLPQAYRRQRAQESRRSSRRRQLRRAQTSQGPRVARGAAAFPHPLYADLCVMAQSGRALVCTPHPAPNPSRLLRQRKRSRRQDHYVRRRL